VGKQSETARDDRTVTDEMRVALVAVALAHDVNLHEAWTIVDGLQDIDGLTPRELTEAVVAAIAEAFAWPSVLPADQST
jgi:hypothetical protein